MIFRYTKHQVPRGAFIDVEKGDEMHIFKKTSVLHATYQIRLLLFRASEERKILTLHVDPKCVLDDTLRDLLREYSANVRLLRV